MRQLEKIFEQSREHALVSAMLVNSVLVSAAIVNTVLVSSLHVNTMLTNGTVFP
jgi:hypothetical protein